MVTILEKYQYFNNTLKIYHEPKQSHGILSCYESPCSVPHFRDKKTDLQNVSDLSKVIFVVDIRVKAKPKLSDSQLSALSLHDKKRSKYSLSS